MKKKLPQTWVIEITQPMTVEEACELGRKLGECGYTGHFHTGDVAGMVRDGAKWRQLQKGGGENGELDQVVS